MLKALPFLISLIFVISHGGMVSLPYSPGREVGVVTGWRQCVGHRNWQMLNIRECVCVVLFFILFYFAVWEANY